MQKGLSSVLPFAFLLFGVCIYPAHSEEKGLTQIDPIHCAAMLMGPSWVGGPPEKTEIRKTLQSMNSHLKAKFASYKELLLAGKELPNDHLELITKGGIQSEEYLKATFGIDSVTRQHLAIVQMLSMYMHFRISPLQFLDLKMTGHLKQNSKGDNRFFGSLPPSQFDELLVDIILNEQKLRDLIKSRKAYRLHSLERIKSEQPKDNGTSEDDPSDIVPRGRKLWHFALDPKFFPAELKNLESMVFSKYTEHHSFSHFSQGIWPETLQDAFILSRDQMTSVISSRLSLIDIFEYLHKSVVSNDVHFTLTFEQEWWVKNRDEGRMMVPFELEMPGGLSPKAEKLILRLIVCAQTPCRVKGLDFDAGEIISVIPISGPGVIRLPPRRKIKRAIEQGHTRFDESLFFGPDGSPSNLDSGSN